MTPSVIDPCERHDLFVELANLLPKPPRSKLEPHRELIRELRRKGRTYREVALLFEERLGFHVAASTLHSFVKVRARHRKQIQFELPALESVGSPSAHTSRVDSFRAKPTIQPTKRTPFVFHENEPLTLSTEGAAQ